MLVKTACKSLKELIRLIKVLIETLCQLFGRSFDLVSHFRIIVAANNDRIISIHDQISYNLTHFLSLSVKSMINS